MTLAFKATAVRCANALDGEILRVTFDTAADGHDEENRRTPCLLIGHNIEFPGPPSIEWHDGKDYGGGKILSVILRRHDVSIRLDRKRNFEVTFNLSEGEYAELQSFLKRICVRSPILSIH